ncbi:FAD binding domain-containing protein [Xinfangfangia pollutisoli]|uniref:FAD binding domain-containing protein n=1 Tax=Xinfangfangia pollutisoli TaxID=2865960 RepID=UPI001CD1EE39|nr:xanthine dehydrogenase family protein subunit M [Xinfangfangia pollutisoli]
MKAPPFAYRLAEDLPQALDLYARSAGDAVYLAGGHSIVPSLSLRLQAPALLIDISRIAALAGVSLGPEGLRIGATTPHAVLLEDPLVATHAPLLAEAARHVAHPAIRNRATFGGNLVLADPASEFPAVVRALRAELEVEGPEGARQIAAEDFFLDLYTTALQPGEILRAVLIPPPAPGQLVAFAELARRQGDFAMVGAAVRLVPKAGVIGTADIVFHSVGLTPMRAVAAEAALIGQALDAATIAAACAAVAQDLQPGDDPVLPAATRLHLAGVLLGRLLRRVQGEWA